MNSSNSGLGATVTFNSVGKSYGQVDALLDFNMSIQPGEFVTLLGPSGSGKTTALNILAGFISPSRGDVQIGGKSVIDLPPEKRNLGMVFQNYSLFPHMNVYENIAFPLRLRKLSAAEIARKVDKTLEMVQLADLSKRMPKELSGGQRQRVAFARAVVFEPPVLLMDEPLGALDLKLREAMQFEIKRYHSQLGCTIVFVTHDQGEALALSDRIAVLGHGRIAQIDTPDRIYDEPTSRYVADFIGKTNILDFKLSGDRRIVIPDLKVEADLKGDVSGWMSDGHVISLRPEMMHRDTPSAEDTISFEATVEEVLFLGNIVQYSVRSDAGRSLFFQEYRGPSVAPMDKGNKVDLSFVLSDARVVSESMKDA